MNGLQATSSWKSYFNDPKGQILGVVNVSIARSTTVPHH
jgi:hypothetical protein